MKAGRGLRGPLALLLAALLAGGAGAGFVTSRDRQDATGTMVSSAVRGTTHCPSCELSTRTVQVDGHRRRYLLFVPPSLAATARHALPLVIAFHGLQLSGAWMASSTGLLQAADRAGVVLALPDAVHGAWNDGRLGSSGPDDLHFAMTVVSTLERTGLVDPKRVTVSGYSNGAELALVLASRYPKTFAAVISVSGALPALPGAPRPHSPVPAYFTHGTADPVQPWGGRPTRNRLHPALLSEDATVAAFVAANRAAAVPQHVATGSRLVQEERWAAAAGGAPVVLYRLIGAGHGWPSAPAGCRSGLCAGRFDAASLVMQVATSAR